MEVARVEPDPTFTKKTMMRYNGTKIICLILTGRVKKASKVTYKLMTEANKNSKRGKNLPC